FVLISLSSIFSAIFATSQSTLFPYTTLFRSSRGLPCAVPRGHRHTARLAAAREPRDNPCRRPFVHADLSRYTAAVADRAHSRNRSEEHTSDSSHVKISYAVFCLKKKKKIYR